MPFRYKCIFMFRYILYISWCFNDQATWSSQLNLLMKKLIDAVGPAQPQQMSSMQRPHICHTWKYLSRTFGKNCLVTLCLKAGVTNMGPRAGEGPPSQAGRAIHLSSGDFLPPRSSSFASYFLAFLVFVNLMFNYRHFGLLSMAMMLGKNDFENHTFLILLSALSCCKQQDENLWASG